MGAGSHVRRPWSAEEDARLRAAVLGGGARRWEGLAGGLPGRSGKSCRLRWRQHLHPQVSKLPFTAEEDKVIVFGYARLGSKWAAMAKELRGRTDGSIKNRWHSHLKKKYRTLLQQYLAEGVKANAGTNGSFSAGHNSATYGCTTRGVTDQCRAANWSEQSTNSGNGCTFLPSCSNPSSQSSHSSHFSPTPSPSVSLSASASPSPSPSLPCATPSPLPPALQQPCQRRPPFATLPRLSAMALPPPMDFPPLLSPLPPSPNSSSSSLLPPPPSSLQRKESPPPLGEPSPRGPSSPLQNSTSCASSALQLANDDVSASMAANLPPLLEQMDVCSEESSLSGIWEQSGRENWAASKGEEEEGGSGDGRASSFSPSMASLPPSIRQFADGNFFTVPNEGNVSPWGLNCMEGTGRTVLFPFDSTGNQPLSLTCGAMDHSTDSIFDALFPSMAAPMAGPTGALLPPADVSHQIDALETALMEELLNGSFPIHDVGIPQLVDDPCMGADSQLPPLSSSSLNNQNSLGSMLVPTLFFPCPEGSGSGFQPL